MTRRTTEPAKTRWTPAHTAGAFAAAVVCILILKAAERDSVNTTDRIVAPDRFQEATEGWPKRRVIREQETLWERPKAPKGVLLLAHGCGHAGSDFWPASERCAHCLGLPAEVAVRQAAIDHGYAVVAVISVDRTTKCWSEQDLKPASEILRTVMKQEGLDGMPVYALGASSGGSFVQMLPGVMPEVKGIIAQIAPAVPGRLGGAGGGRPFPPILWVHMAQRDSFTASSVATALKLCKEAGIPADEVRVAPQRVTAQFLQQSPQISARLAGRIAAALAQHGFVDEGGMLLGDPRRSAWRDHVRPVMDGGSLEADVGHLPELLNIAYALHEFVYDGAEAWFKWLDAGGRTPIAELARR